MGSGTKFHRILLKISGEALMGDGPYGIDSETVNRIAADIGEVHRQGVQICVVVGGGNIFRGISVAIGIADNTRVATSIFSNACCMVNAFMTVANMPT